MSEPKRMIPLSSKPTVAPEVEKPETSLFERVDGEQFFIDLVEAFYVQVADEPLVQSMYPEDLTTSKADLAGFLMQFWGGPATYSEAKGHPRLRMRHAPFEIGIEEQNAWLRCMMVAVEASDAGPVEKQELENYFESASKQMINFMG